ncbi:MAG TPA: SAM-dependent methyltransferase [Ruminococcus sp.]|nr:SAM-dependent methyltransferase [Ruminococcus sp.]
MFWDSISRFYDFFETVYNGKCYTELGKRVAQEIEGTDMVLECACGTGAITECIAPVCRYLVAADMSPGMLVRAEKKCRKYRNISFRRADLTHLKCRDSRFDKVVAGNVIHLLDDPEGAVRELLRVCKPGGKVIIPTYINSSGGKTSLAAQLIGIAGADFKRQFDYDTYRKFFTDAGYGDAEFYVIDGRMPCAVAVITK